MPQTEQNRPMEMPRSSAPDIQATANSVINVREAQMLREIHSQRYALAWTKTVDGNTEAIEAAALLIFKQRQIPLLELE